MSSLPAGVTGVLTASHFPLAVPGKAIVSALLAGNTVVWKPSEDAAGVAYLFSRCMMDAGVPPGVVNIVHGKGRSGCGKHFLAGIDKGFFQAFSFAGAPDLGRAVGEACGRNLVQLELELGTKSPMIVMDDSNIDQAVQIAVSRAFADAGQLLASVGDIILQAPIAESFTEKFLQAVSVLEVGNPLEHPEVVCGPMNNARLAKHFEAHWETGQKDGAALLAGGSRYTDSNRTDFVKGTISHGMYMAPTVWGGATTGMEIFRSHILGPTVNLHVAKDFEEAILISNSVPFAPSATICTTSQTHIDAFVRQSTARRKFIHGDAIPFDKNVKYDRTAWEKL